MEPPSSPPEIRLRFLHGWGFDAKVWTKIIAQLPNWRFDCDDRGYFGPAAIAEPCGPFIFVTHSFGAMRALRHAPTGCVGLVAINGFDRFQSAVPRRVVDRMIARFDDHPTTVLHDFRQKCGETSAFGSPRVGRLRADLVDLRDLDCSAACADWPTPILSLQGGGDTLLAPSVHEEFFAASRSVRRISCPDGGHLLPVSAPEYCAGAISEFARKLG